MVTFTVRSHVGKDGVLNLQLPIGVTDTDVEVVVVLQPKIDTAKNSQDLGYPSLFFQETFGSIPDLEEIELEGTYEMREELV
jgi:hypothetical protein